MPEAFHPELDTQQHDSETKPLIQEVVDATETIADSEATYVKMAEKEMDQLVATIETDYGIEHYDEAADPGYKSSFTRDSAIANTLRGNPEVLADRISFSLRRIGKTQNPITGEEPGKPHHELPSVELHGRSTAYNACDTAAEVLRSVAALSLNGHTDLIEQYPDEIHACIDYIKRHVNINGLFEEDPRYSGARELDGNDRKFGLKVTYWKDSELNHPVRREPDYPIVYSLVHFQNAHALERIGTALGDEQLVRYGQNMINSGLELLWRGNHFVTAVDSSGDIDGPNSDSLHALLYIAPHQLPQGWNQIIEDYMEQLVTTAGYRAGKPLAKDIDPYHMGVWSHEQALLHEAAIKHGMHRAAAVTKQITAYFDPEKRIYPELLNGDTLKPEGNIRQLWAMGAYLYFLKPGQSLF